ncbi:MAG: ornithine carbamoyltransferase [Planctomycetes bacterium]|nr:ornithine carbamoyltransferase [Planctomycetota bacterium]NBO92613.1 ornithine carbamoyltransferase [Planctomycetia bacterium]
MRHFLSLQDLSISELNYLLGEAARMKAELRQGKRPALLSGRVLGLVFEKPSLRTRGSFEASMIQLGGGAMFFGPSDGKMGVREPVADFARTLSGYCDAVALRVFRHSTLEEFAQHATIPVINALSDRAHPCQALGDLLTIQETFGKLEGKTLVFVGDGNNVAMSVALGCGMAGMRFILAAPKGYHFDEAFLSHYRQVAPSGELLMNGRPEHAVGEADVIYTDVWTSMGQEEETEQRRKEFAAFQVNAALLEKAPKHAKVMHCLPAIRGEEVDENAIDGNRSIVFQQAENRMHAQKALLKWLMLR